MVIPEVELSQQELFAVNEALPRTSVHPDGRFLAGIHRPSYRVFNLREADPPPSVLGHDLEDAEITNEVNFPPGTFAVQEADSVVEIPNPFPFWGTTYILDVSAERCAEEPENFNFNSFSAEERADDRTGFLSNLISGKLTGPGGAILSLDDLPRVLLIALAQNSRDPDVLVELARLSCEFEYSRTGEPSGMVFQSCGTGGRRPLVHDFCLFKTVSNNPALPESYKLAMVLMPGVQGTSPVVGEYGRAGERTHIWEYLRANSYIPYGHFAANMAHDAVRYSVSAVDDVDMRGLRALYYQRIYVNMAMALGILDAGCEDRLESMARDPERLDRLRLRCLDAVSSRLQAGEELPFTATLWGWNYGYDFSPSGYRLHASHQMVHQQFALIPPSVPLIHASSNAPADDMPSYAIGDQVADFISAYHKAHGRAFFTCYLEAIRNNCRLDGRSDLPDSLILWEDDNVMLHVPKAQRSQGEIQVMTKPEAGNVLEADTGIRASLDEAILRAVKTLAEMGAEMITCYEVSKRFDAVSADQRLFYCFLPRHSRSPGAFSERQGRWITGHYPEDYAHGCREAMKRCCFRG